MAQCKDCIHNEICQFYKALGTYVINNDCGFYKSTADVVPKNEVEQLERNLKQCENGYRQEMHLLQCKLADEQSKVGEIFEEIDDITDLFAKGLIDELEMYDKLAELKKKYTKSEDNV